MKYKWKLIWKKRIITYYTVASSSECLGQRLSRVRLAGRRSSAVNLSDKQRVSEIESATKAAAAEKRGIVRPREREEGKKGGR